MIPDHCKRCKEQAKCISCNGLLCIPEKCICFEEERDCANCNNQEINRVMRGHYKSPDGILCSSCYTNIKIR